MPNLGDDVEATISSMDRGTVVQILTDYGFQCYDSESNEVLREALWQNVKDGTIPVSVLTDY
ncbi:hypothetical protein WK13_34675 [Burkholderia ubonensis]|uniref:hypothetical protein n=1 Tax=Burkholderia ubonensis TaxID=101571 RepID=UPI0007537E34|nr:hypothetical protein [Burkholderia ubonensis]KVR21685.1 hypothetical protein WK13_34675 [Burkholderia ubonensis]